MISISESDQRPGKRKKHTNITAIYLQIPRYIYLKISLVKADEPYIHERDGILKIMFVLILLYLLKQTRNGVKKIKKRLKVISRNGLKITENLRGKGQTNITKLLKTLNARRRNYVNVVRMY